MTSNPDFKGPPNANLGPPYILETTRARKLNLKMVKYPFWVQKLLHYTIKHERGRHIDFRQMSISEADYCQQLQDGFQPTCRRER